MSNLTIQNKNRMNVILNGRNQSKFDEKIKKAHFEYCIKRILPNITTANFINYVDMSIMINDQATPNYDYIEFKFNDNMSISDALDARNKFYMKIAKEMYENNVFDDYLEKLIKDEKYEEAVVKFYNFDINKINELERNYNVPTLYSIFNRINEEGIKCKAFSNINDIYTSFEKNFLISYAEAEQTLHSNKMLEALSNESSNLKENVIKKMHNDNKLDYNLFKSDFSIKENNNNLRNKIITCFKNDDPSKQLLEVYLSNMSEWLNKKNEFFVSVDEYASKCIRLKKYNEFFLKTINELKQMGSIEHNELRVSSNSIAIADVNGIIQNNKAIIEKKFRANLNINTLKNNISNSFNEIVSYKQNIYANRNTALMNSINLLKTIKYAQNERKWYHIIDNYRGNKAIKELENRIMETFNISKDEINTLVNTKENNGYSNIFVGSKDFDLLTNKDLENNSSLMNEFDKKLVDLNKDEFIEEEFMKINTDEAFISLDNKLDNNDKIDYKEFKEDIDDDDFYKNNNNDFDSKEEDDLLC